MRDTTAFCLQRGKNAGFAVRGLGPGVWLVWLASVHTAGRIATVVEG